MNSNCNNVMLHVLVYFNTFVFYFVPRMSKIFINLVQTCKMWNRGQVETRKRCYGWCRRDGNTRRWVLVTRAAETRKCCLFKCRHNPCIWASLSRAIQRIYATNNNQNISIYNTKFIKIKLTSLTGRVKNL